MDYTYDKGWTVQDYLNSLSPVAALSNPDAFYNATSTGFSPEMLNQQMSLYGGKTPTQFLSQFGVTDPMNQLGMRLPDDMGGFSGMADFGWMIPMGAAAGVAAATGGLYGGGAAFGGGAEGVMLPEAYNAFPSGTGAFDMGGSAGVFDSFGNPLYSSPGGMFGGYSGEGLTQLASDAGDEVAWTSQGFQPTMVDDTGGSGFMNWLANVSPDTWLKLGGTALGAGIGLYSQNKAVDAQTQAANNALALQSQMYQQNRQDLEPWRNAGIGALNQINSQMPEFTRRFGMNDYMQDPGYQFRLAEGEKAINRAAQARGLYDSGATMKALNKYNSNMASQEFGNAYNRFTQDQTNAYNKLSNLAGMGQTTAQQVANLGGQYANNAGELGLQGANARASGYIGGANTIANAINQGMTSYNQSQMLPYLRNYINYIP